MVKGKLKEKELIEHLKAEGFKEVGTTEKKSEWHKKASRKPECLTVKGARCAHVVAKP